MSINLGNKILFVLGTLIVLSVYSTELTGIQNYRDVLNEYPNYDLILLTNDTVDRLELLGRSYSEHEEFYRWSFKDGKVKTYIASDLIDTSYWQLFRGTKQIYYNEKSPLDYTYDANSAKIIIGIDYFLDSRHTNYVGRLEREIEVYPNKNKETIKWYPKNKTIKYNFQWVHETDHLGESKNLKGEYKTDLDKLQINWNDSIDKVSASRQYLNGKVKVRYISAYGDQIIDPIVKIGGTTVTYDRYDGLGGVSYTPECFIGEVCHLPLSITLSKNFVVTDKAQLSKRFKNKHGIDIVLPTSGVNIWGEVNNTIQKWTNETCTDYSEYLYDSGNETWYWNNWTECVGGYFEEINETVQAWKPLELPLSIEKNVPIYIDIYGIKNSTDAIDALGLILGYTTYEFAWWNSSWDYKKEIQIDGIGDDIPANYQLKIEVDYDSDMNDTFKDIRFTWLNGSTEQEIDYWIETYTTSTNATAWLEVPEISNTSNETVYMYYGNSIATSTSNGTASFIQWHGIATTDFIDALTIDITTQNIIYQTKIKSTADAHNLVWGIANTQAGDDDTTYIQSYNTPNLHYIGSKNEGTVTYISESPSMVTNQWYDSKFTYDGTTIIGYLDDDQISTSITTNIPNENMGLYKKSYTGTSEQEWSFVRKYSASEPTYSFGAEESQNTAPTVTLNSTSPATIYTDTDTTANLTVTDPEGDTLTGYIQFYVNDSAVGDVVSTVVTNNTNTLIATLGSGNYSSGDNISTEYWAGDGTVNTSKSNMTDTVQSQFTITLNSPVDEYNSSDNTPDFNFIYDGTDDICSCELFLNDTGYGVTNYVFNQSNKDSINGLWSAASRTSQKINLTNKYIDYIELDMKRVGTITGAINFTIRNASTDSLIYSEFLVNAENVPLTDTTYNLTISTPTLLNGEVYIGVEYLGSGGNIINYVGVYLNDGDVITGFAGIGDTSFTDYPEYDMMLYFSTTTFNNTATIITANSSVSDGYYDWNINCTAGITTNTSETRQITIDTVKPTITVYSPTNTTYGSVTVNLNTSADEDIATWIYTLNGGNWVGFTPNTTFTAIVGINNITIAAYDYASNTNTSSTIYFTVDSCSCPASGNWAIDCADNCVLTSCDMQGNNFTITGTGTVFGFANIYNYVDGYISGDCIIRE